MLEYAWSGRLKGSERKALNNSNTSTRFIVIHLQVTLVIGVIVEVQPLATLAKLKAKYLLYESR